MVVISAGEDPAIIQIEGKITEEEAAKYLEKGKAQLNRAADVLEKLADDGEQPSAAPGEKNE